MRRRCGEIGLEPAEVITRLDQSAVSVAPPPVAAAQRAISQLEIRISRRGRGRPRGGGRALGGIIPLVIPLSLDEEAGGRAEGGERGALGAAEQRGAPKLP